MLWNALVAAEDLDRYFEWDGTFDDERGFLDFVESVVEDLAETTERQNAIEHADRFRNRAAEAILVLRGSMHERPASAMDKPEERTESTSDPGDTAYLDASPPDPLGAIDGARP